MPKKYANDCYCSSCKFWRTEESFERLAEYEKADAQAREDSLYRTGYDGEQRRIRSTGSFY